MTEAIILNNVIKQFDLFYGQKNIIYAIKSFLKLSNKKNLFTAIKSISLKIPRGSFIGLIGSNGSGKTTLLKLISKITFPTSGEIIVNGKVSSLIDLGIGFHHELSGRDNLIMNALLMGMTKTELLSNFDKIIQFSEIEEFTEVPVKRYSTGMIARLSFATAIYSNPDILLIDEVLSVTDINFQSKCLDYLNRFCDKGGTVIFTSHSLDQIERFCNKTIILEKGSIKFLGNTKEAILFYKEYLNH